MILFKALRFIAHKLLIPIWRIISIIRFKGNNVHYHSFRTNGVPYVMVAIGGKMSISENFAMNNNSSGNPIGCFHPCSFIVDRTAELKIGKNVGISQSALVAIDNIYIGDNVKIGGGTYIYSSDFHSLNPIERCSTDDLLCRKNAPIRIHDNVFIGAHCIILKGVEIGENSIIGAGSVVTKCIPANQIWAGNPAKYIRDI